MKLFGDLRDKFINTVRPRLRGEKVKPHQYRTLAGKTWNPLKRYPVNQTCFCGSLEKAKKCCLPHLAEAVSEELANSISKNWDKVLSREMTFPRAPRSQGAHDAE